MTCKGDEGAATVRIGVVSAAWVSDIDGSYQDYKAPQVDMFLVLLFDAANQGPKPLTSIYTDEHAFIGLQLQDDKGRAYRPYSIGFLLNEAAATYGGSTDYYPRQLPGVTTRYIRVFQVNKDAQSVKLVNSSVRC